MATELIDLAARLEQLLSQTRQAIANTPEAPAADAPAVGTPPVADAPPVTTVSVPADTAAQVTIAPATPETAQSVLQGAGTLAEQIVAQALGGTAAVTAAEHQIVTDVAIGNTAGAVATVEQGLRDVQAHGALLETAAQAHTDQIAALEQKILTLAKVSPATRRYIGLGIAGAAFAFFVLVSVLAASGNVWASHNTQLAGVIMALAVALISTPLAV